MPDFDVLQDRAVVTAIKAGRVRDYHAGRHGSRDCGNRTQRARKRTEARHQARASKLATVTFVAIENEAS